MSEETKFFEYLRRTGLKITRERKEILREVFTSHRHFDADELFLRLKGRGAGVSRATVYRTLALLVSSHLVRKMELGDGRATYEHVLGHPHHDHLICIQCNRILEFHHPEIEELQQKVCEEFDFKMKSHSQQIYGVCKECRKKQSS
ncbi:transcriptional repressor [bacterium]|nr:transcriptional repressor [bacterium]